MTANKGRAAVSIMVFLFCLGPAQADSVEEEPLPPWGLTSTATDSGIELSWNAPPGSVDSYNVYRADDAEAAVEDGLGAFSLIGQTPDLDFLDAGESEARGVYFVTAIRAGEESLPSNLAGYPGCWEVRPSCFWPPPVGPPPFEP